ncbi:hypothetical protein LZA78_01555 [Sinirhodobacter sp. WL0062]|uniref:Uncharacterized protein n=1 Tax=Rhodobacter flavimaris TaxID=2907145 RepID=A0ABS8YUP4_9RHOB|nr:hypothetical protein [Sinirhodobacter sp. WL0062]MCE5972176.1 hypothetical protein [Sinirhodobacter sp. WL0062]
MASVLLPAEATALRHADDRAMISALLAEVPMEPGRGHHTVTSQLSGCFSALDQVSGGLFTPDARRAIVSGCDALAQRRLEQAPGHAAAHHLRAEALMAQGRVTQALSASLSAEAFAPNTAWLDQRRVALLARVQPPPKGGQALFDRAFVRLASTPETRLWLAQGYAQDRALRAAISQSAAAIPASDAQRLIAVIRRLETSAARRD